VIYLSEPYQLEEEGLRALVALLDDGWHVRVDGRSPHFPARTVAVQVRRPDPATVPPRPSVTGG
jgi:hypothetical protein